MNKIKRKLALVMAMVLSITAITPGSVFASEVQTESDAGQELVLYDASERTDLDATEIVTADDLNVEINSDYDVTDVKDGIHFNASKVSVTYYDKEGSFDISKTGNYDTYYKVEPVSGKRAYLICRKVKVYEVEKTTEGSSDDKKSDDKSSDDSEDGPSELVGDKADLSKNTVDYFISQGLLYESKQYHNIVFLGNDKEGVTRFASMRGIYDKGGKSFKCDVAGNDKNYGFCVALSSSDVVNVFEAPIDLMSYVELYQAHGENAVALGGVADHPLETFLSDYPHIRTIRFCLDSDEAGVIAANELAKKYMEKGYGIKVVVPSNECKDFNEMLIQRKSLCKGNGKMR